MARRSSSSHGLALGLLCFALLAAAASATQFRVGGQRGWSVPDANAESYNAWAGRMRFQIGDQLLFVYPKDADSVLLVDPAAYNACNTSAYDNKFDDGNTVVTLDRSGPFFFISGNEASCRANEKLIVVVLADRSGTRTPPSSAPVPSPASSTPTPTLAPAPTTATPSSPPALAPSPSTPGGVVPQPPSGSADAPGGQGGSPTPPTPSSDNQQSAASTVVAGFVASLGAYVGYAMLAI